MGCKLDPANRAYKYYRLKTIQNQLQKTKILPTEVRTLKDKLQIEEEETNGEDIENGVKVRGS